MVKILLACSAGMSTSLMVRKMRSVAEENGLEVEIDAVPESQAINHFDGLSILLLGPQVKYQEEKMRDLAAGRFPVMTIDTQKYGRMDGLGVLKDAVAVIKNFRK